MSTKHATFPIANTVHHRRSPVSSVFEVYSEVQLPWTRTGQTGVLRSARAASHSASRESMERQTRSLQDDQQYDQARHDDDESEDGLRLDAQGDSRIG